VRRVEFDGELNVKAAPFAYHAPERVDDAVALLARYGDTAKVLAGGQSLVPMLALRLTVFDHLVDVGRIDALRGIRAGDNAVHVGAGTSQATIEASAEVATQVPLLARATPFIGHFQIRNRGTIGGSLAHADPAAEYPAVALALDATMEAVSPRGTRAIPARDFFTGLWNTALADDELLTGVTFPRWSGRCGFAIEEFARRHGDFALAGAAVALTLDTDDRVERCGVALIGLGSTPVRASAVEAEILGLPLEEIDAGDLGRRAVSTLPSVPSDLHGSAEYRRHLGAVMVARAWTRAAEEARRA
jgi:carbon-monoxide dehydrogenase medium subunit